jgi:class 3 adenylate cyclase
MDSKSPPTAAPDVPDDGAGAVLEETDGRPRVVGVIRRVRRLLPGDPEFGDPLSRAGQGGPRAAARATYRLLPNREAAWREVSLAGLQVWQALTERLSHRPANAEVTIVFTDLVGFSSWSLTVGDEASLKLLRRISAAIEPPMLDHGGHIVKRMGDGLMAVFHTSDIAISAVLAADEAVKSVEVEGFTPRMRFGIHTGRPQQIGSDWLGIDVNIAARTMERATKGGIIASGATLARLEPGRLDEMGVTAKRVRRQMFSAPRNGVPAELRMYWLRIGRQLPGDDTAENDGARA